MRKMKYSIPLQVAVLRLLSVQERQSSQERELKTNPVPSIKFRSEGISNSLKTNHTRTDVMKHWL